MSLPVLIRHALAVYAWSMRGGLCVAAVNDLAEVDAGCPKDFPHRGAAGFANSKYGLCYRTAAEAGADEGPCGSWCQPPALWPSANKAWPK